MVAMLVSAPVYIFTTGAALDRPPLEMRVPTREVRSYAAPEEIWIPVED